MKTAKTIAGLMLGLALPTVAQASDGRVGFSSSASATITVIIPPLGAGIEAAAQGAVGLWTLTSESGGIMVHVPETVSTGQSAKLDIYRTDGNLVEVSLPAKSNVSLVHQEATPATAMEHSGLMRQTYTLAAATQTTSSEPVQVTITAV